MSKTSQQEFMMRQLKAQLIKQIDLALEKNPDATFGDLINTIVDSMTSEAKKNPAAIPLQALSEVIQHYHQALNTAVPEQES
jgi:hypothetical protein